MGDFDEIDDLNDYGALGGPSSAPTLAGSAR
jgi:hypothetical protein